MRPCVKDGPIPLDIEGLCRRGARAVTSADEPRDPPAEVGVQGRALDLFRNARRAGHLGRMTCGSPGPVGPSHEFD